MSFWGALQNLDLLSVGITVAAVFLMGFSVYFSDRRSITNTTFLAFSMITLCWGIVNYSFYHTTYAELALWQLRFILALATLQAFTLFQFLYVFPNATINFPYWYRRVLIPLVFLVFILSLTPFTIAGVKELSDDGRVLSAHNGMAMPLFGALATALVIGSLAVLINKLRNTTQKAPLVLIAMGVSATFTLIIVFNLILPAFYDNARYVQLGALFFFPFIASTTYAIMRHRLFNVRVISAVVLIFALAIVSLIEIVVAEDFNTTLYRSLVFVLILLFGVLLIRSVLREVEAREQIEKLKVQLERANDDLKQLDEAKSDFVSIASHQLRTPLTVIKGYMSMIDEGSFGPVPEKLKQPITKAYQSSERLEDLVENLLSVSRIERGTMKYNFSKTDFVALAQSVVEELSGAANAKHLALTFKSETPSLVVEMDEEKIRQIMANLVDNSIKYTPKGSVTVNIATQDPRGAHQLKVPAVVFTVTDTGDGVPQTIQRELFQKFVRGQNEVHIKGTGLGLYVGRMMVEAHQGKIWVESAGEGKGATFGFAVPLTVPHSKEKIRIKT